MLSLLLAAGVKYEEPSMWLYGLIAYGILAVIVIVPILVIRSMRQHVRGGRDTTAPYRGIAAIPPVGAPPPGYVRLTFHTYSGFLVFFVQRKHDVFLPVDQAPLLLKRLLKHNLTWGLFAYVGIFVPIVSLFEYRSQARKIAATLATGFPVLPPRAP